MLTFSDFLLEFLASSPSSYKKLWMDMAGYSWPDDAVPRVSKKKLNEQTVRRTLSRLKKGGFVESKNHFWKQTAKGEEYLKEKLARLLPPRRRKMRTKKKNLIVAFDIPETMRRKRDLLREELVWYGFEQLQKSVWFGPGPLPEEFIEDLQCFGILWYIRFFQATEKEIVGREFDRKEN